MSLYLNLLKQVLTRSLFIDDAEAKRQRQVGLDHPVYHFGSDTPWLKTAVQNSMNAETMIGEARLENIRILFDAVEAYGIPGDVMECGVWRGGAAIWMRAIVEDYEDYLVGFSQSKPQYQRSVWVADSFEGLPSPSLPEDAGDQHHTVPYLAVSLEEVQRNFQRFGLLDERVKFIKGWFKDTLFDCWNCNGDPQCPDCHGTKGGAALPSKLALLRIDADMYEGVSQALEAMYPKVSPGGFVIIDDYQNIPQTRRAVDDYRARHGITSKLVKVDWCAVWWRKE